MPACSVIQSCQTICNTNCSPSSSSVLGILQARILSGLPCLLPGDLLNAGIKPTSSESPVLQANSLPWATEEAHSFISVQFSQFSRSVVSHSMLPHESQHARPPCPSQTPGVYSNSCHRVSDAIQPSHPLSSPSPPAPNSSQHQGLFQWVSSSHEVAKVLEFQLQHQSFQWTPRTYILEVKNCFNLLALEGVIARTSLAGVTLITLVIMYIWELTFRFNFYQHHARHFTFFLSFCSIFFFFL